MTLQEMLDQVRQEFGLKVEFTVALLTMALMLARILPVILLSPMLGGDTTPTEVKLGLSLMLGLVLFPGVVDRLQYVPLTAVPFIAVLLKELFIGLCLSFMVAVVFDAANIAGQLMDNMSGTNMAQILVPQIGQQVSLYASLKLQLVVTLFLTLNGHHLVIEAFADSLAFVPLDQFPRMSHGSWAFYDLILRTFGNLMRVAVALSAPVMLASFLTDLGLGMINRVAPQVQVFFISMQIKPGVAVLIVFVALHLMLNRMVGEFGGMFALVQRALQLLG
jgi:flagellar biosynthetic protein FliR